MKHSPKPDSPSAAFLHGGNMTYLESLYRGLDTPPATDPHDEAEGALAAEAWRDWFAALEQNTAAPTPKSPESPKSLDSKALLRKQVQVSRLIYTYRELGHLMADIDPIKRMPRGDASKLELAYFGLTEADLSQLFDVGNFGGGGTKSLRDIIADLRRVYCGHIGYEIDHITDLEQRNWLRRQIESEPTATILNPEEQREVLGKLVAADGLERYLHTKYVGQKRFSLEGGDALIPALSDMIQKFGATGVKEIVIGMAHRGRLNVLVNILGKSPAELFSEFEGNYDCSGDEDQTGDVKYHQGASSSIKTRGGEVHIALSFNPSHLEIIDPVVVGSVRARQERRADADRSQVVPIIIHGDAAFTGQGVVMETLNMARTRGYSVGGSIHIIVNNQIGFTTNTLDARSTLYCTEIAKMVQAPIFHVNGDAPEAVIRASRLAQQYRTQFGGDAIVDIVCYRRHGHNEADDPSITQPIMYSHIKNHPTPQQAYAAYLAANGVVDAQESQAMAEAYRAKLDAGQSVAPQVVTAKKASAMVDWRPYLTNQWDDGTATNVDANLLQSYAQRLSVAPPDFVVHRRVQKLLQERVRMAEGSVPMDWGCAELLAYASILGDGYHIRLSGQDAGRGTFSHRHATLHDQSQARTHIPLQHLDTDGKYLVTNSLLSEEAVLGFEYGYATTDPRTLVIWEAQFGDFVNGAQVVIDQFISSGQAKWQRVCGLTLFLPHGMEGQGPEHSSARLERFLQLCTEANMQVCTPTTPAQIFHLLRRQILRPLRRPLIVMTPKSLLRHKLAVSTPEDLSGGKFHTILEEVDELRNKKVKRLVLCAGKVYYDLLQARRQRSIGSIAIVRIEQLRPFPSLDLEKVMRKYPNAREVVWCQEEAKNQGSWYQIAHYLNALLQKRQQLRYVGRKASPSPAVGYYNLHLEEQKQLVDAALDAENYIP